MFHWSFISSSPCSFYSLQYCHYVAGLVGVGLSKLFSASKLEDPEVGQDTELANSMGLFLQKTNIIRDYLEDMQEGRAFWPQEASLICVSLPDRTILPVPSRQNKHPPAPRVCVKYLPPPLFFLSAERDREEKIIV